MPDFSRQAKAVAAFVVTFLVQVQVYVGQGGIETLQAITLGQWISVAVLTLSAYGVVYAIPNVTAAREIPNAPVPTQHPVVLASAPVTEVVAEVPTRPNPMGETQ